MKINKEMFLHFNRWHNEYESNKPKDDLKDIFLMIEYLFNEIEKIEDFISIMKKVMRKIST